MTRIIERSATGPIKVPKEEIAGKAAFVCGCGLSATQPFCDGSHGKTRDEEDGVLYVYERDEEGDLRRSPARVEKV